MKRSAGLVLLLFMAPQVAHAGALPAVLQAALIARIFQPDDTIRNARQAGKLLVVKSASSAAMAEDLVAALAPTQIVTQDVAAADLPKLTVNAAALYVFDPADGAEAQKFCIEHSSLCIAGNATLAERGVVAIALAVNQQNHPEIVVNTKQLALQQHVLTPALLKLARLVGE